MQQREKVRVYILARELNIETADLLRMCKQVGFDVKNQLSSLDHDQQEKLEEMVKQGAKPGTPAIPVTPVSVKSPVKALTPEGKPVPNLAARPAKREPEPARTAPIPAPAPVAATAPVPAPAPIAAEPIVPAPTVAVPQPTPVAVAPPATVSAPTPAPEIPVVVAQKPPVVPPAPPKPAPLPVIKENVIPILTPTKSSASSQSTVKTSPAPTAPAATVTPPAAPTAPQAKTTPKPVSATPVAPATPATQPAPPAPKPVSASPQTPPTPKPVSAPPPKPVSAAPPKPVSAAPPTPKAVPATPPTATPPTPPVSAPPVVGVPPSPVVAKQDPVKRDPAPVAPPTPPAPQPPARTDPPRPPVLPTIPSGRVANLSTGPRTPPPDLSKKTPAAASRDPSAATGKQPTPPPTPGKRPDQGPPKKTSALPEHLRNLKPLQTPQLKQPAKAAPPKEKILEPLKKFTPEQLAGNKPLGMVDLLRPPPEPVVEDVEDTEESRDKNKKKSASKPIPGRNDRKAQRTKEAEQRKTQRDLIALVGKEDEDPKNKTLRRHREKQRTVIKQRATHLELEPPFTVRSLSEELGIRSVELMFKLREQGAAPNITINSIIDSDMAQVVALLFNCELVVLTPESDEDKILKGIDPPDTPEDLVLRAPVVTVMGHVDHGKTSLLDKIRQSNVAATEAGGITQVIRAWRVEHGGRPVTFLDTPGHEAFTKMRARGAQVTDVAVIVVAADDGVMPQTEEAINHAKAAGVSLVVAINKVDLPSANVNRTRQQLYGLNVLPDNMGGDTPFVETSAATGKGIDDLLETLALVAELKELKANPKRHARGTCLEAMMSEEEGVRATLLVRDGTLRKGDVILCGATFGRVRQLYNDLGQPIQEAGPSVPVRITGLDAVPEAGDMFHVVPDLTVAADIAERRGQKMRESSGIKQRPTITWERLTEAKIDELKIILKADFRGSIEAIRKELDKLQHAEVRVRILEAGIGGITENDLWLALASPEDTMIVGFNSVPDDRARALAEERGVQIREYNIIYNLTNDIRAALEGKLKPREEIVHLGRAIVRDTFKISRVGTIGGCYVTQGNIKRNAKVRIIRDGVVIYPPADRTTGLDSLKRFKEDVGEVREGFECGIKVAGYDDIKAGDVIEAYRVEQVQRTLE